MINAETAELISPYFVKLTELNMEDTNNRFTAFEMGSTHADIQQFSPRDKSYGRYSSNRH